MARTQTNESVSRRISARKYHVERRHEVQPLTKREITADDLSGELDVNNRVGPGIGLKERVFLELQENCNLQRQHGREADGHGGHPPSRTGDLGIAPVAALGAHCLRTAG